MKEISKLRAAADRSGRWADKNENTKIGYDPIKEHDRCISTRAYIGAKTKKMQSRVKNFEKRIDREIEEKEGLLNDIEKVDDLKLIPLIHHKKCLVECKNFSLGYRSAEETKKVSEDITFQLMQGDILFLNGENGCGKSTLIKAIINDINNKREAYQEMADVIQSGETGDMLQGGETGNMVTSGKLETASGLVISYINQSTSHLSGSLKEYAKNHNLDYSIFLTLLRKLDMGRVQFEKNIEEYSEGQKKKVLIAASLLTSAHLYIWDEPLNYIDVFSRMQIEKLIESFRPTMILVEHDVRFQGEAGNEGDRAMKFVSHLKNNKAIYRNIWVVTFPIILQNVLDAAVNSVDVLMLNTVGQSAISSASLANSMVSIFFMFLYGIGTGIAMLGSTVLWERRLQNYRNS